LAIVASVEELCALYGAPNENSTAKEADWIIPEYRRMIEASPFAALATSGPEGLDCSPRGDLPGFVRVHDERTLMLPDRMGNNRVDSLANIVRDPRCALMFLIPGWGNALRVNGRAVVETDEALRASFAVDGKAPRSVIVMTVEAVYFQCARAIVRSPLWDDASHIDPAVLPTAGQILASVSNARLGGEPYDTAWPARAAATLW
jgi:uncharacterized protein